MTEQVSIITASYNAEQYIGEVYRSCCEQTYDNIEWCVHDDGSTDKTVEIVNSFKPRGSVTAIRVQRCKHEGLAFAFNGALSLVSSGVVARIDHDDSQKPNRIERQVSVLRRYSDNEDVIVSCGLEFLYDGGSPLWYDADGLPAKLMPARPYGPPTPGIVTTKAIYDRIGGYEKSIELAADLDWVFRVAIAQIPWVCVPEPLYIYRRHPGAVTDKWKNEARQHGDEIRKRYATRLRYA